MMHTPLAVRVALDRMGDYFKHSYFRLSGGQES